MKALMKARGPRDCSLIEVVLHIANLTHQYREDRKIFENDSLAFEARQGAYVRMCKALDLLESWKEVRSDIFKKNGMKEVS